VVELLDEAVALVRERANATRMRAHDPLTEIAIRLGDVGRELRNLDRNRAAGMPGATLLSREDLVHALAELAAAALLACAFHLEELRGG
jgi:hypothetical protein